MCCILNQLDYLNLSYNSNIRDEGVRSLIPCLEFIAELHIYHCGISDAVKEEIKSEHRRRRLIVRDCVIITRYNCFDSPCVSGCQSCV